MSQCQDASKFQIRRIWEAFMQNNQVRWIVTDYDAQGSYEAIILENRELPTGDELNQFLSYCNE